MLCKNLSIRRKLEIGQHDGFAVRRIQNVEGQSESQRNGRSNI